MSADEDDRLGELQELCERQAQQLQHCRTLLDLQGQERKLFALEIHDGFVQQCTGALMLLESLADSIEDQPQPWTQKLTHGIELLRSSLDEARRLMRGIRPPGLEEHGVLLPLETLIADFENRLGLTVEFQHPPVLPRLITSAELAVYRIVQEALHNVWKHAQCSAAVVRLDVDEAGLSVSITDRGQGFDPASIQDDRLGIAGIIERTRLLGGEAEIASSPDQGTHINVTLPHDVWAV